MERLAILLRFNFNGIGQDMPEMMPEITWLNMSGDVTIRWSPENKKEVLKLVRAKMREGYSFFVLKPVLFGLLPNRHVELKREEDLEGAVGVVMPDDSVKRLMGDLGDVQVEELVKKGTVQLVPKAKMTTGAPKPVKGKPNLRLVGGKAVEFLKREVLADPAEPVRTLSTNEKPVREISHRATTAEEVVESRSVAIRPIVGG